MSREILAAVVTVTLGACGVETADDRPHTLEYISATILEPSCGTAACHSSFRQAARRASDASAAVPLVFDSVEHARATFQRDSQLIDNVASDLAPTLYINLTVEYLDATRMPLDQPLPNADVELLRSWVLDGGPGVCVGESSCQGAVERYCHVDDRSYDFTRKPKGPCELPR
ncbi:MAG: hypothetical protein NT062_34385 [Proteobacteria bacterium]|nr:hypothetical protein [Pseudomonadota bacterium]